MVNGVRGRVEEKRREETKENNEEFQIQLCIFLLADPTSNRGTPSLTHSLFLFLRNIPRHAHPILQKYTAPTHHTHTIAAAYFVS